MLVDSKISSDYFDAEKDSSLEEEEEEIWIFVLMRKPESNINTYLNFSKEKCKKNDNLQYQVVLSNKSNTFINWEKE